MSSLRFRFLLGSDRYPAPDWPFATRRDEIGVRVWAAECIETAKSMIDIIRCGGSIQLNQEIGEEFRYQPRDPFDYREFLGFDEEVWDETLVHLAWLYIAIRTWGGFFRLDRSRGLYVVQEPRVGTKLQLEIGPHAEDGCNISCRQENETAFVFIMLEAMNGVWDLYQGLPLQRGEIRREGWSLQTLRAEERSGPLRKLRATPLRLSKPSDDPKRTFSVEDLRKFAIQPWSSYGFGRQKTLDWELPVH